MTDVVIRPPLPRTRASRPVRLGQVVAAGLAGAAALAYVGVRDPHQAGVAMPRCPLHWATGLECPGCGGLRMTHDLLHGDLSRAWQDNAVLLVLAPVLLFLLARGAVRRVRGRPGWAGGWTEVNGALGPALGVIGLAWMVVRNLWGW